ncbi:MAG: CBS domain-containing protein [Eubacteriales bacterium]|nr:CBS domain-containing protein [Eubacteriales bacterium]MDD4389210.1 CBS domain-containing protein [Eubacteriales bacterium]
MQVKDLMTTGICGIKQDAAIREAAVQMQRADVGSIPVCSDSGEILGIITDRDIVIRSVASQSYKHSAGDIMSTNIVTVSPETNVHDAALLLSTHKIRRLPVVSGGKLVGVISLSDIAKKRVFVDEAGDVLSALSSQLN